MTDPPSTKPPSEGDPLFIPGGADTLIPTPIAASAWGPDVLHGGPVAAVVARAAERALPDDAGAQGTLQASRLTVDLFRAVPRAPLVTDVELAGLIPLGASSPFEQVEAAIDHCRQLGVTVVAAPLDPAPDPDCGPPAPTLTDDTWCENPIGDDGVQVKRVCAEETQAPFPVPTDCRGRHWGSVRLSGGGSAWHGTYTNGYAAKPNTKENRMGELSIQYDWNAGTGSGDWGQPYIGRGGRIENVTITAESNGARFSFEYYTTQKGDQDKVISRLSDKPRTNSGFFCAN